MNETLAALGRLLGTWETEATHPMMPGVVVHGTAVVEWLEGERFLIHRAKNDHPDFPDSISVIGVTEGDGLHMHYYDSRGVFRDYGASIDEQAWKFWRETQDFGQRFEGKFADGGDRIDGLVRMIYDGEWKDDLAIVYRRKK